MIPSGAPIERRGLLSHFAYDRDGYLHSTRLLGSVALAIAFLAFGTFIAMWAAALGEPQVLGFWTVITFLAVKIPLLAILWWLLVRHTEAPGSERSRGEVARIVHHLEESAVAGLHAPDADERIAFYAAEARHLAGESEGDSRALAEAAAERIEGLSRRVVVTPSDSGGP